MEIIQGKILEINPNGTITIVAKYDNVDRFVKRQYKQVEIGLNDGRTISPKQRRLIHSLINSIAEWQGDLPAPVKRLMKLDFLANRFKSLSKKMFSLANCDMTLAQEFSKHLIEFVLEHHVDLNFDIREFLGDKETEHYLYMCLKHKRCSVCGRRGELHHVDRVGMRSRDDIVHEGMEAMCLCREHHTEVHAIGDVKFGDKYLFRKGIPLDKELCKVHKLKARSA